MSDLIHTANAWTVAEMLDILYRLDICSRIPIVNTDPWMNPRAIEWKNEV